MHRKLIALIALASLLAIGLLAGCSSKGGASIGEDGSVEYNGKAITITVPSNPTTGYEWSYALDGTSIKYTGENYSSSSANSNLVGAGGTQTYTFEGVSQGESKITLTYARSWETTDADITCTITVGTDGSGNVNKLVAETVDNGSYSYSTGTL